MYFEKIYNMFVHGISMIIGACLGIGVSFIVNCTLIEISKTIYFAYVSKNFIFNMKMICSTSRRSSL